MNRRPRSTAKAGTRKGKVLARLYPDEAVAVLHALLERHPELLPEAEGLAKTVVADVDVESIAEEVEHAVLEIDLDDLGARTGRTSWGYVERAEAACELLEEALEPFLTEMKRRVELGFKAAAVGVCQGIVLGLYQCRGKNPDQVLGWAEDFPAETAVQAVAALTQESSGRHRRA
jgi:hypothetical protein